MPARWLFLALLVRSLLADRAHDSFSISGVKLRESVKAGATIVSLHCPGVERSSAAPRTLSKTRQRVTMSANMNVFVWTFIYLHLYFAISFSSFVCKLSISC